MTINYLISWHPLQSGHTIQHHSEIIQEWQQNIQENLPDHIQLVDSTSFHSDIMFYHVFEYHDLLVLPTSEDHVLVPLVLVFHYQPEAGELKVIETEYFTKIQSPLLAIVTLIGDYAFTEANLPTLPFWWGVTEPDTVPDWSNAKVTGVSDIKADGDSFFCHQIPKILSRGEIPLLVNRAQQQVYLHYGPLPITVDQATNYHLPMDTDWSSQTLALFRRISELTMNYTLSNQFIHLPLLDTPDDSNSEQVSGFQEATSLCVQSQSGKQS